MANEIQQYYLTRGTGIGRKSTAAQVVTEDSKNTADAPLGDITLCVVRSTVSKVQLLDGIEALRRYIETATWPSNTI